MIFDGKLLIILIGVIAIALPIKSNIQGAWIRFLKQGIRRTGQSTKEV
jgi:hypothetical protein